MKPYGIKLQDRRKMYDSDKFNSRDCFNTCKCNICSRNGVKHKIRINTSRRQKSLNVLNSMRSVKKRQRFMFKILIKKDGNSI